ncbi:Putative aminoglycoside phosphotransferase [Mycobacteroides abscessus subsp. bolletii]|uniref:phosphotransferase family protein n=1 Tax=Mycobacteroides abscessus TaxID=36809 RepID=UPI0009A74872|nr:phosphotransferase [Mycobacteroides abscessus]SKG67741.1 Putative aminoglycoside phosphotransferase [Mycobacteroides abscessus subsp. bolletii]SKH13537.1 Putative aminoglycoside phosphotransferase [Mycobacteroides abscessus subsp. bolletii]
MKEKRSRAKRFLVSQGLIHPGEPANWTALTGGVSSDLWLVESAGRSLCVKAALETLRVADDWHAPVRRNSAEYRWLAYTGRLAAGHVPQLLAHDEAAGFFAMEYLPPERYPVWKTELMAGRVERETARAVGDLMGRLHAVSASDPGVPQAFSTDEIFAALRIEPYFETTARRNPISADRLRALAGRTASTRRALVHGDLSPKNILVGPHGPVLLDAECAWFGDPAFDPAFCLTHLLLKSVIRPESAAALRWAAEALLGAYLQHADWEPASDVEARVTTLLPALLLARVDGASPVEYLAPQQQAAVRTWAISQLTAMPDAADAMLDRWFATATRSE